MKKKIKKVGVIKVKNKREVANMRYFVKKFKFTYKIEKKRRVKKVYEFQIESPDKYYKFNLSEKDAFSIINLIIRFMSLVFFVIVKVEHTYLKFEISKFFSYFLNFKKCYYFLKFSYDEYMDLDEEFFELNLSFLFDKKYIECYNIFLLSKTPSLYKFFNFEEYYELDKKKEEHEKNMVLAYNWDYFNTIPHFFSFCKLEMCTIQAKMSSFTINFFNGYKISKNTKRINNRLILFEDFYLKVNFFILVFAFEYITFLRRMRYQEYLRMHFFFTQNYKTRKFFMNYLYITRITCNLTERKEIAWVTQSLNSKKDNFQVYNFYRKHPIYNLKFDTKVLNLVQNHELYVFQNNLNKLNDKFHQGLKWLFASNDLAFHITSGYKISMLMKNVYDFYFIFLRFKTLSSYFSYMISTPDLIMLYYKQIAVLEESTFVNTLIYQKKIIHYYFFLDLLKYKDSSYFKKLNDVSFFFSIVYFLLLFKIKKNVRFKMTLDSFFRHEDNDVVEITDLFERLFMDERNILFFFEHVYKPKYKFLDYMYNTNCYFNWKTQISTHACIYFSKFNYTYYNLKSTFDFIYYNRFQTVFQSWRFLMKKSATQDWKLLPLPYKKVTKDTNTDDLWQQALRRKFFLKNYKKVNYLEKILNFKHFKNFYLQLILASEDLDYDIIGFFLLIEKQASIVRHNFEVYNLEHWTYYLRVRQDSIFMKELNPYKYTKKEEIDQWIVDGYPNTKLITEHKYKKNYW